ncbi:MAG: flagellar basal body rod protein FlgB [Roseburia sp.]
MINTDVYSYINVLDKAADASWMREEAISNNIANVSTPGYKRQDVDFESVLQKELGNSQYTSLDEKVRNVDLSGLNVSAYTDSASYSYRLDGNNVDIDTENVELASETIRYQALTENCIASEFTRLTTALGR